MRRIIPKTAFTKPRKVSRIFLNSFGTCPGKAASDHSLNKTIPRIWAPNFFSYSRSKIEMNRKFGKNSSNINKKSF